MAFTGTTPALLTPQSSPQLFSFLLAGSSIAGYTQAGIDFQISVTNHILAFTQAAQTLNVPSGEVLTIPPLLGLLQRDETAIDPSVIQSTSATQPTWLTLDSNNLSFSGTAPDSFTQTSFEVSVTDDFNNVATTQIQLQSSSGNANSNNDTTQSTSNVDLGTVYATVGDYFQYTYKSIFRINKTDQVNVDLGKVAWLNFIRSNLTVQGVVPKNAAGTNFDLDFVLTRDGQELEDAHVTVVAVEDGSPTSSNGPPTTSDSGSSNEAAQDEPSLTGKRRLILLITMPILGAALVILIAFVILRKCRERRQSTARRVNTADLPEMQQPYHDSSSEGSLSDNYDILADTPNSSRAMLHDIQSSPPPRIELPWSSKTRPTSRLLSSRDTRTPTTRSSWDQMLEEIDSPYGHVAENNVQDSIPLPPPRSPARPRILRTGTKKFQGRRRSGLGHGSSLGSPSSGRQLQTLRQVSISPIDEHRSADRIDSKNGGSMFASMNDMLQEIETQRSSHAKTSSSGSNSRYAPAKSMTIRTSGSEWEDDDWRTESSGQRSHPWHARLPRNKSDAGATLSSEEAAVAGLGSSYAGLASAVSQGRSLGQNSAHSQSNSLRFI